MATPQEVSVVLKLRITPQDRARTQKGLEQIVEKAAPKTSKEIEQAFNKGVTRGFTNGFDNFKRVFRGRFGAQALATGFGNLLANAITGTVRSAVRNSLEFLERERERLRTAGTEGSGLANIISRGQTPEEQAAILDIINTFQALGVTSEQLFDLFAQSTVNLAEVQKDLEELAQTRTAEGRAELASDQARGLRILGFNLEEALQGATTANLIRFFNRFIERLGTGEGVSAASFLQTGDVFEKLSASLVGQNVPELVAQRQERQQPLTLRDILNAGDFGTELGLREISLARGDIRNVNQRIQEVGSIQALVDSVLARTITQSQADARASLDAFLDFEQVSLTTQRSISKATTESTAVLKDILTVVKDAVITDPLTAEEKLDARQQSSRAFDRLTSRGRRGRE